MENSSSSSDHDTAIKSMQLAAITEVLSTYNSNRSKDNSDEGKQFDRRPYVYSTSPAVLDPPYSQSIINTEMSNSSCQYMLPITSPSKGGILPCGSGALVNRVFYKHMLVI
eukprot:Tbor_TRINITY_DN5691_c0_g1::TRINITY_DN5691_c0_g1_i2::g.8936::m.8936